ncbi:MAG: hypothetical protein U0572_17595 [Phycisphaerales bacterium]
MNHRTFDRPASNRAPVGRRGVTLLEVCIVVALAIILAAISIPALATVGCSSMRTRSRQNLAALARAHTAYAADWTNRQFTMVPDDVGAFGGCGGYISAGNCITGASLGTNCNGLNIEFTVGCAGNANCGNFDYVNPIAFSGANVTFGAYRIPNAAGFQPYVDGRFYSPTFYAPDDAAIIGSVEPYFASRCSYAGVASAPVWSSYAYSPSAMLGLGVLTRQAGYKNPNTLATGYASPPITAAVYPSLKTQIMEFRAIEGQCAPWDTPCDSYQFNQLYEARPLGLMFDGSVRIVSPREAMESDQRVKVTSSSQFLIEKGLWVRNTPLGPNGVGGAQAYDFLVDTSYHFLTGDGIAGRDVVE